MVADGSIDLDEALRRVTGAQLAALMFPRFDPTAPRVLVTRGMNASPGAAVGRVVFDSATATHGRPEARTSSWSGRRPTRTTCLG